MAIEDRLEAVERELIRLNKTLRDLITIYVDAQAGGLLQNVPKADGYLPQFIKERDKLAKNKGKQTITSLREVVDYAVQVLGVATVEDVIGNYPNAKGMPSGSLSEVDPKNYQSLYAELMERIPTEP